MADQQLPTPVEWLDARVGILKSGTKKDGSGGLRKVYPEHWSYLRGEIALYSFVILILTGIFLTFWFKPSMAEVEYQGSYSLLKGLHMSEAYASTLNITFDIRGGLLIRQIHHWAAVLFIASMMVHLLRIFFTGALRKPRELNWLIGFGTLFLGIIEGFIGYGLPDDLLSGTGLRITNGMIQPSPVIGTYLKFFIFGGEFPGDTFVPRFFTVHVLLLPGLLLALITVHLLRVHREAPTHLHLRGLLAHGPRPAHPVRAGAGHRRQRRPRPAPGPQQGPRHPVPVLRLTRREGVPIASVMGTPSGVMDSGGSAVRKDPVRAGEVARVARWVRQQVVLVLRLSLPERRLRLDRGHRLAGPQP
ncbi:cytochrome b N-terminal domain-containing protein [Kribbella sp. NBC_01510]